MKKFTLGLIIAVLAVILATGSAFAGGGPPFDTPPTDGRPASTPPIEVPAGPPEDVPVGPPEGVPVGPPFDAPPVAIPPFGGPPVERPPFEVPVGPGFGFWGLLLFGILFV